MTPPPIQQPASPAMHSEKLLRDALLKDERERQQLSSPVTPPTHRRRHSHVPTSSYSGEEYTRGSSLFRSAMSSPRSPSASPSSFSQGEALENGQIQRRQSQSQSQRRRSTTSGTPTRIPVRIQTKNTQRKEGGLETRRPTQRPEEKNTLRPLDLSSSSSPESAGKRQRDITITQQAQLPKTSPKKSNNTDDGHSLASTESRSTRTSISWASHPHSPVECVFGSGYCSSRSSLDGLAGAPQPHFGDDIYAHSHPQSDPTTKTFNARKASNQCRAIQGYVSFASVEGLGEPPLVGDELDGDGGQGAFVPFGMWNTALGWKKLLGRGGGGVRVEGQQGVVV